MYILILKNKQEYFLAHYTENDNSVSLTIGGCLVSEIKSLTEDDLSSVQIYDEERTVLLGEYSNMELGASLNYDCLFDQTTFSLQKHGTADLETEVKELKTTVSTMQPVTDTLGNLLSVTTTTSDKSGYNWRITSIGNVEVLKEYIKADEPEDEHDGSDYTKPAYYVEGGSVEKGKWYCEESDPDLRYECIKSGTPSSFNDSEYFDIVIG